MGKKFRVPSSSASSLSCRHTSLHLCCKQPAMRGTSLHLQLMCGPSGRLDGGCLRRHFGGSLARFSLSVSRSAKFSVNFVMLSAWVQLLLLVPTSFIMRWRSLGGKVLDSNSSSSSSTCSASASVLDWKCLLIFSSCCSHSQWLWMP